MVSKIVYVHPYLGKWSNLTNSFQRGWNHQPVIDYFTFRNLSWVKFKREVTKWHARKYLWTPEWRCMFPIKHVDISASYVCVPEAILKSFGGFYLTILLMEETPAPVGFIPLFCRVLYTPGGAGFSEPSTVGLRFDAIGIFITSLSRKMVGFAFEKRQGNCVPQRFLENQLALL